MILVDSSVWIDYFNGTRSQETDYLDVVLGSEPIGIGDLMLAEVLQGFKTDSGYRTAKTLLQELQICAIVDTRRAIKAAENYRFLRKKGVTVRKTIDSLIAAYCIEENCPLLFSDRDFIPFVEHLGLTNVLPDA